MKNIVLCFSFAIAFFSCKEEKNKTESIVADSSGTKSNVDLPYTASYTSNWTSDVSDADTKTVLTIYKDWENNNITGIINALADSVSVDFSTGDHFNLPKADIAKMWATYRDSLSSVKIDMISWHKMYAPDKKDGYIVAWYDETDTYKNGKVDSAPYHDINQVKNGKLTWYSTYKRIKK